MAKKYKVADKNAIVVKGVVLGAGEAIPEGALDDSAIKTLAAAKKIVEDKDAEESADDDAKGAKGGKSGGKKGSKESEKNPESDGGDKTPEGGKNAQGGSGENAENGGGQQ